MSATSGTCLMVFFLLLFLLQGGCVCMRRIVDQIPHGQVILFAGFLSLSFVAIHNLFSLPLSPSDLRYSVTTKARTVSVTSFTFENSVQAVIVLCIFCRVGPLVWIMSQCGFGHVCCLSPLSSAALIRCLLQLLNVDNRVNNNYI